MPLVARRARPDDLDALVPRVAALYVQEEIAFDEPGLRAGLAPLLADDTLGVALLFEVDGAVCGYAVVTWGYDVEFHGRDAFLTDFFLDDAVRGRGFGAPALAEVEAIARAHGVRQLHLFVHHHNHRAQRLYDRAGYRTMPRTYLTKAL